MNIEEGRRLAEDFLRYFEVGLALGEEDRRATWRVRYRVYCEEFGYEPAERFPNGEEKDLYDDFSTACLVRHRETGMPAGCVRLVPALPDLPLPLERHCGEALDRPLLQELGLERTRLCEISRLAVDGAFRRRSGEAVTRFGEIEALQCPLQERRTFPLIAVALFLAATAASAMIGRNQALAMMEPFLPRLVRRSGIVFRQVGKETEYHGVRAPFFGTLEAVEQGLRQDLQPLYRTIRRHLAAQQARHSNAA